MRVCFFGAWDPEYPRVRVFREALALAGVDVVEARVPERRAWRRYPELARAYAQAPDADVVLVPAFRHKDVPLARAVAGPRPLIFDPLVSRWDTLVEDWGLHGAGSAQARWNRAIDRWSFSRADRVLCDTWAHGALFVSLGARKESLRRVPVGAEAAFFAIPPPRPSPLVRVVYVGGFLPLHGVSVVLAAARELERQGGLPEHAFELVGEGIEFERAGEEARALGLAHVTFLGRVPYARAPEVLAGADVVLGAFGTSEKAGRVVPHKVWQGLAAGRAVVTGDGPGFRELFQSGRHAVAVPRGDAGALATALAGLIADPTRRAALADAGRARARETGAPEAIGACLREVLEDARWRR